jgi:hypothetical protein
VATPPPFSPLPPLFVRLLFAISVLSCADTFQPRVGFKFTILSNDFNAAGQRESFLADHAWKLMWGLPAAMTDSHYCQQFGIQESLSLCLDAGWRGMCGPGSALYRQSRSDDFSYSFVIGLLILNETPKSARTNLRKVAKRDLNSLAFQRLFNCAPDFVLPPPGVG